jgi:hypothetical protein
LTLPVSSKGAPDGVYVWPKATQKTEKWRFKTMIGAKETVTTAVINSVDDRYAYKQGYEKTVALLREALEKAVSEVANPDSETKKAIEDVVEKSTNMWMDFGTQRYRLKIVMPMEEDEKSLVARLKQKKAVELVTNPLLLRIGTSKGGDFGPDTEKVLVDGEKQSLVPQ